jgi:hypothetical protein
VTEQPQAAGLQTAFAAGGLTEVFVSKLGWDAPTAAVPPLKADGLTFRPKLLSSLKGFRIYGVPCAERPTRQLMRRVDTSLKMLSPERLEVFQSPDAWFWHWPRRTPSGTTAFEAIETKSDQLPTFLAQRLTGLRFTVQEHRKGFTLADVRDRVHGHFDATNVTNTFYKRFQAEHAGLTKVITGIPKDERPGYATTLLNRLMFLYFMQKKEFLNGDPRYLENTVAAVQKLRGRDYYYSFYRDALLPLFFVKLNERGGNIADPEIAKILGSVPYVNGGIFGRTDLEQAHSEELAVPDSAFEQILGFFSEFNWHLDTRPTGNPDEINPEVIGYIFEQYINFASSGKKENGAYYTPHDVTAHMVAQTLVPRILDDFSELDSVFELLRIEPDRYIQPAMLHGWDEDTSTWCEAPVELTAAWAGDPTGWTVLDDADFDPALNLPGETWVETFHRRTRVESLRQRIAAGEIKAVNGIITDNLNGQLLLADAIDLMVDGPGVAALFAQLTNLTVFDPTCGSGAFLFAALEVLEDVYAHVIDVARAIDSPATTRFLAQVDAQPSARYFVRKHIAIRNLYGTDLMPGAIETAKLRIFLALAACVDTREELQPLPDLDFNLKAGNLVVGFKDAEDVYRVGGDLFTSSKLDALAPKIDEYAKLYAQFVLGVEKGDAALGKIKEQLRGKEVELRNECNSIYREISDIRPSEYQTWLDTSRPFHWFCEFPEAMRRGGFDVVIGNPPYVRMTRLPGYQVVGYQTNGCPDLYAVCHERSLSLTHERGRHAFIVMLNLAFSDKFASLRQLIAKRGLAEWWSTYGKWPTQLFNGVRMANTMLVNGPGDEQHSTRHFIFGRADRGHLFQTIEFYAFRRRGGEAVVRGGVAEDFLREINALPSPSGSLSKESLFIRPTGQYWFPVLFTVPPVLNAQGAVIEQHDHSVRELRLRSSESRLLAGAALAGKVPYSWWSAVGDDFHMNADEADTARKLAVYVTPTPALAALAKAVRDAGRQAAFVSKNNDGYINVRWLSVRDVTDQFDRALLDAAGLLQYWRPLNIWYRQCMRATRANNNSRPLTPTEIGRYLKW